MKFLGTKRMKAALISGAALGVVCIIGAMFRLRGAGEFYFLLALWFNRVLMGMVIGLAGEKAGLPALILRGALLGLFVSFAFYSATAFRDPVSFLAGIVYGVIIELVAGRIGEKASAAAA